MSYTEEFLKEHEQPIWLEYRKGVEYNRTKNLYDDTEKNYNFYHGKQWENAQLGDIQPTVQNIIKPIVKYKLGVIYQNHYEISYNPQAYATIEEGKNLTEICKQLDRYTAKIWENEKVDQKVREATKDACINDEGIIHSYYDVENDRVIAEVIDKNNIYYGNENTSEIQNQPYIIITYRIPVTEAVRLAENVYGIKGEDLDLIMADDETREQAGYSSTTDEVNDMCLIMLKYYKKDNIVYYDRATKYVTLEKDKKTEMTRYPVAHMNWEKVKGSARGIGAVNCVIPNQIEINRIDARRCLAVQMGAFQRLVYNEDLIQNPEALKKVGGAIKVKGGASVDDVRNAIGYIYPASMSPDASNLSNEMKVNTRELEGAGDDATGHVDPTKASGRAILAVQQANQQPLSEQVENYKEFIEDIARIWYEIWKAYKVNGMDITYEEHDAEGNVVEVPGVITNEQIQTLEPNIKVDITPHSPYDRYAQEQSLENLFLSQRITFEEYVESLPEGSVMPKNVLEQIIRKRKENEQKITEMQMEANALNSAMNQVIGGGENGMSTMPPSGNGSQAPGQQPSNLTMSKVQ
jgi:hypothetical protein